MFGLIIFITIVGAGALVVATKNAKEAHYEEESRVVPQHRSSDFSDSMTAEERALQILLRKGVHNELEFLRKPRDLDSENVDEFIHQTRDYTIYVYQSGENIWGKILLNKANRIVCFFDKNPENPSGVEKEVMFYHRFMKQNDNLVQGFIKSMINTDWSQQREFAKKEETVEKGNRLSVLDTDLKAKVDHILETYQRILLHKDQLDFETRHTITTLMEKDIKRLIESYTHLDESGRTTKRETFSSALDVVLEKLDEVMEKINNNKVSELDISSEIIRKRLRK